MLGISLSCSFLNVSELFFGECFETFVVLSEILLPIKSSVASAVFLIPLSEALSGSFWLYSPLKFLLNFYQYFFPYF